MDYTQCILKDTNFLFHDIIYLKKKIFRFLTVFLKNYKSENK